MPDAYAKNPGTFPARQCPSCQKWYHAKRKQCPACGTANEAVGSVNRARVKRVKVKRQRVPVAQNHGSSLEPAIQFVQDAGGVERAKEALATLELVRTLPR